ncbi:Tol-Pal system beta propeller repeat protein TolB [Thiomicrorhabdus sp.]|uniref:Tol-Pal system beta propeller repeat protein TolB n=1 Tax=Thiomicrorhabdus sp. TaxID=2039724 RepID=UPI0029C97A9A|nr:Tol-Pal system beta propeller repeat protein TolB [Thiomicrorhabdus sp.]
MKTIHATKTRLQRGLQALVLSCLAILATPSMAELTIEINEGYDNALPIALVPFKLEGASSIPQDVAQIVANDLRRSGRFKPVSRGSMPQKPSDLPEIDYGSWRGLDIDNLVIGKVTADGNGLYQIDMRLMDVLRKQQMIGKRWTNISASSLRQVAHQISDLVYEALTGVRGAFNTQIAYVTLTKKAKKRLYTLEVADADGYNPQPILRSSQPIMSPSWSPDGSKIAYVSFESGRSNIIVQSLDGTFRTVIAKYKGINGAPAWSPDGTKLAMTLSKGGNADIYIMDVASKKLRQVTRNYAIETEAVWAPDGKSIFYNSDRRGNPQIFQLNLENNQEKRITFEGKYNANPELSPNGRYLAMVQGGNGFHIALLDRETGDFRVISDTYLDESPSFSPNGEMILYAMNRGGSGQLAVVTLDGHASQTLRVNRGEVREPAWGPFLAP